MLHPLGHVTLRTGETVGAAIVRAPDLAWAERIERMLQHKGEPWNWQNSELLRESTGLDADFFVLHRDGVPLANIMLVARAGVALLGHVWTEPADRKTGASSILMERLLEAFVAREGRAIFLGTEFDSTAWHYYRRRGFEPVEERSGYMVRQGAGSAGVGDAWFDARDAIVEPLDWPHWPTAAPLCLSESATLVRLAATGLIGRGSSEGALLPLIRDGRRRRAVGKNGGACVLRDAHGAPVLGIASRREDPTWPNTTVLDVFCHPRWWHRAGDLMAALPRSEPGRRTIAYADANDEAKQVVLADAGLKKIAVLPKWVKTTARGDTRSDVFVFAGS
jgi:GNAT superfamily N-acetyltransferase